MTTTAYQGRGSHLATSPDGVTYTNVAQLKTIVPSGLKVKEEDITNLDSPTAFMEILPTVVDPGDFAIEGILDPQNATINNLATLLQNRTLTYFKITLPENSTITFQGYVQEYVPGKIDAVKAITFSGKIRVTGAVTITP